MQCGQVWAKQGDAAGEEFPRGRAGIEDPEARMVTQRRHLRLLPCSGCGHLRASHYLLAPQDGRQRRHFSRPRDRATPMPCHVLQCSCARFEGAPQSFPCPACTRDYATRASLEIHLYGQHAGLSPRERSVLLQGALHPRAAAPAPSAVRTPPARAVEEETAET